MVGDLTKNLSRREFACECGCGADTIDFALVTILQELCDYYASDGYTASISITGPNRCKEHNEVEQKKANPMYVPFSSKSKHMDWRAADFKIFLTNSEGAKAQVDPKKIDKLLKLRFPDSCGIGLYHNRNHLDSRSSKARWDTTA